MYAQRINRDRREISDCCRRSVVDRQFLSADGGTLEENGKARYTYADPGLTKCAPPKTAGGITDSFDTVYMRCLYVAGCTMAFNGDQIWHYHPDDLPQSPVPSGSVRPLMRETPDVCTVQ